jgi:hypothetical protein
MREINHLRRKTWEKVRKGGLDVGKAAPFSDLSPAFSHFDPLFSPVFDVFARLPRDSDRFGLSDS